MTLVFVINLPTLCLFASFISHLLPAMPSPLQAYTSINVIHINTIAIWLC